MNDTLHSSLIVQNAAVEISALERFYFKSPNDLVGFWHWSVQPFHEIS